MCRAVSACFRVHAISKFDAVFDAHNLFLKKFPSIIFSCANKKKTLFFVVFYSFPFSVLETVMIIVVHGSVLPNCPHSGLRIVIVVWINYTPGVCLYICTWVIHPGVTRVLGVRNVVYILYGTTPPPVMLIYRHDDNDNIIL